MSDFVTFLLSAFSVFGIVTPCLADGAEPVDAASRASRVRDAFAQNVVTPGKAMAQAIQDAVRVEFTAAPELLAPNEEITLTIRADSAKVPNAAFEVWQNCYAPAPNMHRFTLDWKKDANADTFTAVWTWRPPACGAYLIRWQCDIGGDIPEFWRTFSVIDAGWAVMILNSTSHIKPRPEPEFHRLHLPFSYWAESTLFNPRATAEDFVGFSRNARQYGDDPGLLVFLGGDYVPEDKTVFYDEPETVQRAVLQSYAELWKLCRFPRPLNSLYTYGLSNQVAKTARSLGVNLLGALCSDQNWGDGPFKINHWGMPARPYFVSDQDFRKPGPGGKDVMVGIQQCERQSALCRDYDCVYSFEAGIAYMLDQYSGINRPRIVNETILSRELDFLECFLNAADQAAQPYLFSCGIEMNGVWPEMADINKLYLELVARRAQTAKFTFTNANAAADWMRRHAPVIPETTLYLPDVYAGFTRGEKPPVYPDTMEVENADFHALFRHGETLPYAQYDYTVPWNYPDWGNDGIPRRKNGYVLQNTDDRFRVTPSILDTRNFTVTSAVAETAEATRLTLTIEAKAPQKNLALAVWDIARTFTRESAKYNVAGAKRFVPIRAAYTNNLCGVLVADIAQGPNYIELTVTSSARPPESIDIRVSDEIGAKVFERNGGKTAYLFAKGGVASDAVCLPPDGVKANWIPFDSDEAHALSGNTTIHVEPGKCQRLTGLTYGEALKALPGTRPAPGYTLGVP